jgi:hypothetical protein
MPVAVFACLYHWYTSAMFVAPVLAVGGWGWWSTKRMPKGGGPGGPPEGGDPSGIGERPAF